MKLQGSLPAPGAMAVLEVQSTREPQDRAAGGIFHGPMAGPLLSHPCLVKEADFIGGELRDPGLPPDDLTRGTEVVVGVQGFQ